MDTTETNISETTRRRAWLASLLMRRESSALRRLTSHLERLRSAPRPWRRRLQRQLAATLAGAALILALAHAPVSAASNIPVVDGEVAIAANGKCSLREAIINANNNNQTHADCAAGSFGYDNLILPTNGTFQVQNGHATMYGSLTGLPLITSGVSIEGNGSTIRRVSATPFRLMALGSGGGLILEDLTLSNGHSTADGGAIYSYNGYVILSDTLITGNRAEGDGGGLHFEGYTDINVHVDVRRSVFRSNVAADDGGAIGVVGINSEPQLELELWASDVEDNQAGDYGGAVYALYSNVLVHDSTISSNSAVFGGGGIQLLVSVLTGNDSTFNGNSAEQGSGGAIRSTWSGIQLINSTLSGNDAWSYGGGVHATESYLALKNSTLTQNNGEYGGGIAVYSGDLTLERSLISGNSAPQGREAYVINLNSGNLNNHNLFGHSGSSGLIGITPGGTNIVPSAGLNAILDPVLRFNLSGTATHALVANSPALDAAPSAACNAPPISGKDQRAQPRNQNGKGGTSANECDIGAFEYAPPPPPSFLLSPTAAGPVGGLTVTPSDILWRNGTDNTWLMWFDGSDVGVDKALSAFSHMPNGDLLLSFKTNVTLPDVGTVTPWDVVRFDHNTLGGDTTGTFHWYIDGSDVGLTTAAEKIDALEVLPDGRVLISTAGALAVPKPGGGTLKTQDEDLAAFTPTATGATTTGTWALYFNGTAVPGLGTEDVVGALVSPTSGDIYLVILGPFTVGGVSGNDRDVLKLTPDGSGGYTVSLYWRGGENGFNLKLGGID